MRTAGIVAEYNPYHNGHRYQLSLLRARGFTHLVVVMSGNLVQRGEPALFSKWVRAEAALRCGADLVLELPACCAISSAERFSYGAVFLLNALGSVDALCFGAESADQAVLQELASVCLSLQTEQLAPYLKQGLSFPAARQQAVATLLGPEKAALLKQPNNILGIEYCKALQLMQSDMIPLPILRAGAGHDKAAQEGTITSASHLRQLLRQKKDAVRFFPEQLALLYQQAIADGFYTTPERLFPVLLAAISREAPEALARYSDCGDGLARRLWESAKTARSLEELYFGAKTKWLPLSRIRRAVYAAAVGIPTGFPAAPPYLRVLGANSRGRELLKLAGQNESLPIFHSFAKLSEAFPEWAAFEQRAETLWRLACQTMPPGKGEYQFASLHKIKGESQ